METLLMIEFNGNSVPKIEADKHKGQKKEKMNVVLKENK
jgi:hypothetical protein